MQTSALKIVNRAADPRPAPAVPPVQVKTTPGRVQLAGALKVSSPHDPAEREAEQVARRILDMPEPGTAGGSGPTGAPRTLRSPYLARMASGIVQREPLIARKQEGRPKVSSRLAAEIDAGQASGSPLPPSTRRFMEPRFGADFSSVRVHAGEPAARMSRQLNAQAFTVGNRIFFGRDRFQPDNREGKALIAHELTHTIQQGGAAQDTTVRRRPEVRVSERSSPQVQRLGLGDALDYFADKANLIPGFRMFTIILGMNPINMSRVDRSAANILRALVEFLPGGALITQALDNYGVFDRAGAWVEQQIRTLGMTGSLIRDAISRFLDSLSWRDIFNLGSVWDRARRIFTEPIDRLLAFGRGLVNGILQFIKDAILMPLARLASNTRGWDLLCAVLGRNPITGDAVPRTADTLIGGFMKLIGQGEVWENIKRGNAVARAWAWFQGALAGVLAFVQQVPTVFMEALRSLEIADLVLLPRAFVRVGAVFAGFAGQFISWAGQQVLSLLEIIFEVVAPGAMVYLRRAAGAFRTIIQDPIRFVGNLVRAGIQGFRQFAANFLTHLRASLIGWLTGTLSGANIYIPQAFNLREIIKFVLSVLGLTWQNIRGKLVRAIGETAVGALETGFDIVVTLVRDGPAAAWEKIQESLSNLREMVMEQIMTFVRDRIITAAITRLVTSLNPAGAFIQAVIAIYNTVMFFVERLRQIAQVAMSFIDSIAAIASGVIAAAANRVEQTMAGLLTLVISFLARLVGLGNVAQAVTNIVTRIRAPIDRALDRVVDWIVAQARRLGRLAASGAERVVSAVTQWWRTSIPFRSQRGHAHRLFFVGEGESARLKVATAEMFDDAFIARIEAVFAADPLARSMGASHLAACREAKGRVDTEKVQLERTRRGQLVGVQIYERRFQSATRDLATHMAMLVDLLPENQATTFPVRPGEYVSIPYERVTRRSEILVAAQDRVHFRMDAISLTRFMPTTEFLRRWGQDILASPAQGAREEYLGATPGKASSTGRELIRRKYADVRPTKIRAVGTLVEVEWAPGRWHDLADCDMSHDPVDAVDYWNNTGRPFGPRSDQVRTWMLNWQNYILEPAAVNRARGSRHGNRYLPP